MLAIARSAVAAKYDHPVTDVHFLLLAVALTWLMIMTAGELHTPTWTRAGFKLAFGNRDQMPDRSVLAGRADRAAKNMLENMVLFIAVFVAAKSVTVNAAHGSAVFLLARVAYFGAYLAGIIYVRSVLWAIALGGLGWITLDVLSAG